MFYPNMCVYRFGYIYNFYLYIDDKYINEYHLEDNNFKIASCGTLFLR